MHKEGGDPEQIAKKMGLLQKHDEGELGKIVDQVISENPKVWQEYKNGKAASLQYLIGQGMKLSKGSANPSLLSKLFREALDKKG